MFSWEIPGKPPKSILQNIPILPGIYIMQDKNGDILYVGKAKNLKNRVGSYFKKKDHDDFKTTVLVGKICGFELMVTRTEYEALILENQLIKQHKPRYNILLKDDKSYPYIRLSMGEPFPKVEVVRYKKKGDDGTVAKRLRLDQLQGPHVRKPLYDINEDLRTRITQQMAKIGVSQQSHDLYFGPFPSIGASRMLSRLLVELFPIRTCKQSISLTRKEPKCMLLDIGKCIGPCVKKDIKPQYDQLISDLIHVLSGKDTTVIKRLTVEMKAHSNQKAFEKAAECRDKIAKLKQIGDRQLVDLNRELNLQIWTYYEEQGMGYCLVQGIEDGKLSYQQGFYADKQAYSNKEAYIEQSFAQVLTQHPSPKHIICDEEMGHFFKRIKSLFKGGLKLEIPKRGLKKELLENAHKNAKIAVFRVRKLESEAEVKTDPLLQLHQLLQLSKRPETIFGFDISHLQGTEIVASAVCFSAGIPDKSRYRKFKIKTVSGKSNDPASMYEVVYRRLQLAQREQEPLPDLILIDGGRAQLNFASKALADLELLGQIEIVSLAKKEEEIYTLYEANPLKIKRHEPGLKVLQYIRDEAHRFALSFQRKRRNTSLK